MKFFNTNTLHNAINIAIPGILALCAFDWSPYFEPNVAKYVVGALAVTKLLINVYRDGVSGMVKVQPPVSRG